MQCGNTSIPIVATTRNLLCIGQQEAAMGSIQFCTWRPSCYKLHLTSTEFSLCTHNQEASGWTGVIATEVHTWDSCYFERISSCTIADALGHCMVSKATSEKIPWLDTKNCKTNKELVLKEYLDHCGSCYITQETNPDMFHDLLRRGTSHWVSTTGGMHICGAAKWADSPGAHAP